MIRLVRSDRQSHACPVSTPARRVCGSRWQPGISRRRACRRRKPRWQLGASRTIDLAGAALARAAAFLITNGESAAFHLDRLRARADDFDPDTRDRFLAGAMQPSAWYIQAQRVRRWFHDQVMRAFEDIDLIVAPATPCVAPLIGQTTLDLRGESVPLRPNLGIFTQPISAIGLPVAAVPVFGPGLPIGVQLIAAPWREDLCLRAAFALEQAGVCAARPPVLS
jgi:1-carboxybiuret hydrolase